mmetsp:Transcript_19631/g.34746  ORF Transcript_19631/g.34746 Transcript_19631/m.34746 type:complete len:683 (+) Transcript_19631:47-2095(+)
MPNTWQEEPGTDADGELPDAEPINESSSKRRFKTVAKIRMPKVSAPAVPAYIKNRLPGSPMAAMRAKLPSMPRLRKNSGEGSYRFRVSYRMPRPRQEENSTDEEAAAAIAAVEAAEREVMAEIEEREAEGQLTAAEVRAADSVEEVEPEPNEQVPGLESADEPVIEELPKSEPVQTPKTTPQVAEARLPKKPWIETASTPKGRPLAEGKVPTEPESESEQELGNGKTMDGHDLLLLRMSLENWKLQEDELQLGEVFTAKAAAVGGMSQAIAKFDFSRAKDMKTLRDLLTDEQTVLWRRLVQIRDVHRMVSSQVDAAVKSENFEAAQSLYEVQQVAEGAMASFGLGRDQDGSAQFRNGFLCLGDASSLGLLHDNFSLECWIFVDDFSSSNKLFQPKKGADGGLPTISFEKGCLEVRRRRADSITALVKLPEKQWTHVALTWNRTEDGDFDINVYQDGLQVAFGKDQNGITADSKVRLGPFSGKLSEFRIWDHAKSKDEVAAWMRKRCKGTEDGLRSSLSLKPGQELRDATLDPGGALAPGHPFASRGTSQGDISWDGESPGLTEMAEDAEGSPDGIVVSVESFPEECLAKAWRWLESQQDHEAITRRQEAERRIAKEESRRAEEQRQREEQLRRQAEEWARKSAEMEQQRREEYLRQKQEEQERRRERRMRPFKNIVKCACIP